MKMSMDWYFKFLNKLEEMSLATIARVVPFLIALAPAWTIQAALVSSLKMSETFAWLVAAGFEGMIIYISHVNIRCWAWNKQASKTDQRAPFVLMTWLIGVYLVVGLILVVVIKWFPTMAQYAPAFFLILGPITYITWGVQINLNQWTELKMSRRQKGSLSDQVNQLMTQVTELTQKLIQVKNDLAQIEAHIRVKTQKMNQLTDVQNELVQAKNELAQIEAQIVKSELAKKPKTGPLKRKVKKGSVNERRALVNELMTQGHTGHTELINQLVTAGYKISLSTLKRDIEVVQNGSLSTSHV